MAKRAPGKHYRAGLSLVGIIRMFPSDAAAGKWIASVRWPDGPACPYCGSVNVLSGAKHKTMTHPCREKGCRKRFSVRVGTTMQDSKLGLQTWAIAIYLMTTGLKGRAGMKLHRDLGVTQKTALAPCAPHPRDVDQASTLLRRPGGVRRDLTLAARRRTSTSARRPISVAVRSAGPPWSARRAGRSTQAH